MLRNNVADEDVPVCGRCRDHIGAGLNLVGNNGIGSAVQMLDSPDFDYVGSRAAYVGAHGV